MTNLFRAPLPGGWPAGAPPRSVLYSLQPYGCSGECRESLGSFISRLSAQHGMSRGTLTNRLVGPVAQEMFEVRRPRMARDIGRAHSIVDVSGLGEQAHQWAHTLNRLTLRTNLQLSTLLPLRGLVPTFKLLSDAQRYCPGCYLDDAHEDRDQYHRLLWVVDAVRACPLHGLRLVDLPKTRRGAAGNSDLTQTPAEPAAALALVKQVPASQYQVEMARLIAELLDDAVAFPEMGYSASAQSAFLTHASATCFYGMSARFAAHLGVGKSLMHDWIKGKARMSLPRLALIAYCCNCAIADILLGNRVMISVRALPASENTHLIRHRREGARKPFRELEAQLARLIREDEVRDGTHAAELLGVSRKFLRRSFPVEHAHLVKHGGEERKARGEDRRQKYDDLYIDVHNRISRSGTYPSRRRVQKSIQAKIGKNFGSWNDHQRAQHRAHARSGVPLARGSATPPVGRFEHAGLREPESVPFFDL